jgi:hypothetical protein
LIINTLNKYKENMGFMSKVTEIKKGKLTKANGTWFVDCITERAGENNWHHCFPIYELEHESEKIADLKLVEKYNKPVNELEQLDVKWKCVVTDGVTNFGYKYAVLV